MSRPSGATKTKYVRGRILAKERLKIYAHAVAISLAACSTGGDGLTEGGGGTDSTSSSSSGGSGSGSGSSSGSSLGGSDSGDDAGPDATVDAGSDATLDGASTEASADSGRGDGGDSGSDGSLDATTDSSSSGGSYDSGSTDGQACTDGQAVCNGVCTSTQSDPNNCGACGNVCIYACQSGLCCPPFLSTPELNFMICSGQCVEVMEDNSNCGGCGHLCAPGANCSRGTCFCGFLPGCFADRTCQCQNGMCQCLGDTTGDGG